MKGKIKGTSAAPKVPEGNTGKEFIATGTIGWTPMKSGKNKPKAGAVKWEQLKENENSCFCCIC